MNRAFRLCLLAAVLVMAGTVDAAPSATAEAGRDALFARAERFLLQNKDRYLRNGDVRHHWIGDSDRFWYLRREKDGARRFVLIDASTGKRADAFDHPGVAKALSSATGITASPDALPFDAFRYADQGRAIEFIYKDGLWTCTLSRAAHCERHAAAPAADEVPSPDGRWTAFLRGGNLWLRATANRREVALTSDGRADWAYADIDSVAYSTDREPVRLDPARAQVLWSPDSRYLLTHRIDEREVRRSHLVQSSPPGQNTPRHFSYPFALPGDDQVARLAPLIFEVNTLRRIDVATAPVEGFFSNLLVNRHAWWSGDGKSVYFIRRDRSSRHVTLHRVDAATGETHQIIEEVSDTWIRTGDGGVHQVPNVRVLSNGDVLWYSERSGWGHIYRYDATGRLLNAVTSGDWIVREIAHVDEAHGTIFVMGSGHEGGADPYDRYLYAAALDGSGIRLLTPEPADHDLAIDRGFMGAPPGPLSSVAEEQAFSPSGRYFVSSHSRPDIPPVTQLRRADGELVRQLEEADIDALSKQGFVRPERFSTLAADGSTPIYGVMLRPSDFDPSRPYPVIDSIYPGPQISRVWPGFSGATFNDPFSAQALAELGFIVVMLDGRGTPHRSKTFYDASYGRLGDAGNLDDHVAAIRQLAQKYRFIDLERVGIWGASGGGYATAHALLTRPDFFKVGVAAAGNHDQRGYSALWGETYNGPMDSAAYDAASNPRLASALTGKLLLIHGEMDNNVNPALTMQLANRLILEKKNFDLLIVPDGGHRVYRTPYALHATWNYFLKNLAGRS